MKRRLLVSDDGNFCLLEHGDDVSIKVSGTESFDVSEADVALISESIKKADKLYDKDKREFVAKSEVLPKPKETDTMNPDNIKKKQ